MQFRFPCAKVDVPKKQKCTRVYLSENLHMSLYHLQHVGADLIQVLYTSDIHCQ